MPWSAVNLVDFYLVRRGLLRDRRDLQPERPLPRWAWRGLIAYAIGFLAMVPSCRSSFFTAPVTQALGGADISFAVGLVVAGGLYYLFSRNLDRSAEAAARERSQMELEGVHAD